MAEETIENPAGCPSGTVISVYHLEAGEYMLEFEAEDMETFRMAIAAMGGAHDHGHDHGGHGDHDDHDDHGEEHHVCHDMTTHENHDEYTTEEECEAAGHSWMEDAHADEEGPVCHDEDTHENHDEYETEEACEAAGYHWMEDDHDGHDGHDGHDDHDDHNDEMTPEEALSQFDTDGDGNLSWDEFWVAWNTDEDDDHDDHDHEDEHHDENETDGDHHDENETDGDHDDHDHEDEHTPLEEAMEDYMMETLMTMFNESDADSSGGLSLEELEHFIEDIDAMEGDDMGMPTGEFIVGAFDEDGDGALSFEEFSEMMGMEHDHDHDDNETHDGNETHDDNETSEDEFMEAMMQMMFDMYDMNSDGSLDASEVDMMFEMMMQEDDHHEEGVAFIGLHVEEEGDYGIALPEGVSLHVLMDGDHEGPTTATMTTMTTTAITATMRTVMTTTTTMRATMTKTITATMPAKRSPLTPTAGSTPWPSRLRSKWCMSPSARSSPTVPTRSEPTLMPTRHSSWRSTRASRLPLATTEPAPPTPSLRTTTPTLTSRSDTALSL